jgi:FdhE protein
VLRADNPNAVPFLDALRSGRADLHAWAVGALADLPDAVDSQAGSLGLDPALARAVLRLALLPVLERLSGVLAPLRPEGLWTRGECPHCGSPTSLGESRGLEQARYWRCGLCAADWPGHRFRCPFCGETDHRRLSYVFAEGEPDRARLTSCETCGGRLTVVSTLAPLSAPGLVVAELAASHLEAPEG